MLISRELYNRLVHANPEFMRDGWLKLKREWHLGGVTVYAKTKVAKYNLRFLQQLIDFLPTKAN